MTSLEVISLAGLLSGVLDLAATSTLVRTQDIAIERLLQTIASGALGPAAFQEKENNGLRLVLHIFCVGLPIALIMSHFSR
jgi:hypothetical protein